MELKCLFCEQPTSTLFCSKPCKIALRYRKTDWLFEKLAHIRKSWEDAMQNKSVDLANQYAEQELIIQQLLTKKLGSDNKFCQEFEKHGL